MAEPPTATRRHAAPQRPDALSAQPSTPFSILSLTRLAAAGDEPSIAHLYKARFDHVYLAARIATGRDESFCLDVVQETFLRLLRAGRLVHKLRDDAHADRWLARMAQTVALDILRAEQRRARRERIAAQVETQHATPDDTASHIASLQHELNQLTREDRELLHLRSSGMTLSSIADAVGATIGSVHGRIRRLSRSLAHPRDAHHD